MWDLIVSVPDHCLSFYFSKAFDKVNHLKLLFKLSTHGVKGRTLKWISSFLGVEPRL